MRRPNYYLSSFGKRLRQVRPSSFDPVPIRSPSGRDVAGLVAGFSEALGWPSGLNQAPLEDTSSGETGLSIQRVGQPSAIGSHLGRPIYHLLGSLTTRSLPRFLSFL